MTHAECRELLLELAYGELDPARAAELAGHLAGCADCQREKLALDEARRMTASVRNVEEPSTGFDEKILAAARAQAQLEHEGNIGEVIEVQGSVRPLGLEPARVDAHGKVAPRRDPRKRPPWVTRAALGGSVAAAAALALVVSTSLSSRHDAERAARLSGDKSFEIRVQPAPLPQAVGEARREAVKEEPPPVPQSPPAGRAMAGSGGDSADAVRPPAARKDVATAQQAAPNGAAKEATAAAPSAPGRPPAAASPPAPAPAAAPRTAPAVVPPPPPPAAVPAVQEAPAQVAVKAARPMAVASTSSAGATAAPPASFTDLEQAAQQARHAGDYLRAAALYRDASGLRRAAGERTGDPAWDLAHAVECLASVGQFDEARKVRDELAQLYPSDGSALLAAGRALRSVDAPAAAAQSPSDRPK